MGLEGERIPRAKEASEIFEWLGDTAGQAQSLVNLASVLHDDNQLDAAEEAASRAIDLLSEEGEQFRVCMGHRVLGRIYQSRGNTEKAFHHYEAALEIASSLNLDSQLFWIHYSLSDLFFEEDRFDDAHAHVERAKSHAINDPYNSARASRLQARFLDRQNRFKEAKSEALRALGTFEKLGATDDVEYTRELLGQIDRNARGVDSDLATPD